MSVEFFVRAILIASLALFTAACGGGGGGGSDAAAEPASTSADTNADESTENEDTSGNATEDPAEEETEVPAEEETEPYIFTRTQFEYLPFTDGTSIQYDDGSTASVSLDTNEFAGKSVYAVVNNGTTLYFSTTATKIALHGMDGSITKSTPIGNVTITKLRFHSTLDDSLTSIPLLFSTTPEGHTVNTTDGTATAKATVTNFGVISIDPLRSTSGIANSDQNISTYGLLPTKAISLSVSGTAQTLVGNFPVDFEDILYLARGIGIIKHQSTDYGIDNEISALADLPTTIWFNNAAGTPSIDSESDSTFSIAGGDSISSTTHRVANIDDLNEISWLTIQEDTASNTFNVDMNAHAGLPTTLTSIEVIFENKETHERLSGNVTIQPVD